MTSLLEKMEGRNIYCCVLVQGKNPAGEPAFCYFGLFLEDLRELLGKFERSKAFNPKDVGGIVLARGKGEPDPLLREFMQRKFSFCDDKVILELSHPHEPRQT